MIRPSHQQSRFSSQTQAAVITVVTFACLFLLSVPQPAAAQTWTVLHSFTGTDGEEPSAGLTMDQAGNLYGTAAAGGHNNNGTVFKLTHEQSGWIFNLLYAFNGPDGSSPQARVMIGPDGSLYGTTENGGAANRGTVFRLQPPQTFCKSFSCPWTETVLYSFQGGSSDGESPQYGDLVFDSLGNIYGTTPNGGNSWSYCSYCLGTVYKLTHTNGGWTESIVHYFQGTNDGAYPFAGLTSDGAGNWYGTAEAGGAAAAGVVYKLTPSGSGWNQSVIFDFPDYFNYDGGYPFGGLIFDSAGNLYGTTSTDGQDVGGTAYELNLNRGWAFSLIYSFSAYEGSLAKLAMDPSGNLYGTLSELNNNGEEVYKLTPSNGGWARTGFTGGSAGSAGNVILDSDNNVYGTDFGGYGTVFEIQQ